MSRRVLLSLLSLPVLAALVLAAWYFVIRRGADQATLRAEEGTVAVGRGRSDMALSPPETLKVGPGDQIATGADSSALILLFSGASVELGADTDVILRRLSVSAGNPPLVELEVQRGDTWHRLASSLDLEMRYEVLTLAGSATLSAGSHHITVSNDGSTRVEVSQGVATVRAKDTEVEVWSGEYTSLFPGAAPSFPRATVGRFVFVAERAGNADIWLLDQEGRELQLTHHPADDLLPAWSPDGSKIAYESVRDGNSEIYVMNSEGSGQVNLTRNSAADHGPVWSPDGTRIAFESLREGGRDIYIMNADGSDQIRLTFGTGLSVAPRWSADGEGIIFTRIEVDTNGNGVVDLSDMGNFYCVGPEGGTPQLVWENRMIFDQLVFPWARTLVG